MESRDQRLDQKKFYILSLFENSIEFITLQNKLDILNVYFQSVALISFHIANTIRSKLKLK